MSIDNIPLNVYIRQMRKYLILAATIMQTACSDLGPENAVIEGKTSYPNAESLRVNWEKMEACSHIKGNFDTVKFSIATSITWKGEAKGGIWLQDTNEIIVVDVALTFPDNRAVDHEIMHALLKHGGHPSIFFDGLCGDLMNMWNIENS